MGMLIRKNKAFLVMNKSLINNREGVRRGLVEVGPEIRKEVKRLIKDPIKTGRIYIIRGKPHQASAPGEAPANLSGRLAGSVSSRVSRSTQLIIGDLASRAPHGKYMEFGTKDGRIKPRPHLKPAALSKAREVKQSILREVQKQLDK